jgi:thiamine-phosphate diphosphorylase
MENKIGFRLLVISDRKLCRHKSLEGITREAFSSGVKAFQLREKDLSASELLSHARNIKKISTKSHAKLIINDRLDIALLANADGITYGDGEAVHANFQQISYQLEAYRSPERNDEIMEKLALMVSAVRIDQNKA